MSTRRVALAALAALAMIGGGAAGAAAKAPAVIVASDGQPGRIPTYPGPDGARIPEGACAAVQGGQVLVLPCTDPRVRAYRSTVARAQARAADRWRLRGIAGILLLAGVVGALTEWRWHRRSRVGGRVKLST